MAAVLTLSLVSAARTILPALGPDVVQDDARQWIFWMARFRDPRLFQHDLIADLYESLAPPGYKAIYWAFSPVADPLLASKLLPPVLGTISVLFTFLLSRRLHPSPLPAFLAAALLNWLIWQGDTISSATPRAFQVPLLVLIAWALVAERLALAVGLVVLAALLYPGAALTGVALLGVRLVRIMGWRPALSRQQVAWLAFAIATGLVLLVLLVGERSDSRFGPLVTPAEMAMMPDFGKDGRHPFFQPGRYLYLNPAANLTLAQRLSEAAYALLHTGLIFMYPVFPALLPLLLLFRRRLPEVGRLSSRAVILVQMLVASFGLFCLAQVLLFRLYYPDRYMVWSQTIVFVLAVGLAFGMLFETVGARLGPRYHRLTVGLLGVAVFIGLLAYPTAAKIRFVRDAHPEVTAYLRKLPEDVMVAGVPLETNSLPVFAQRSVLMSYEHVQAYHLGYYEQLRRRIENLIDAYYEQSPQEIADFAARYGVDVFLVDRLAFDDDTAPYAWRGGRGQWEPYTPMIQSNLRRARHPALLELARTCAAVDDGQVAAVPTSCLPPPQPDQPAST